MSLINLRNISVGFGGPTILSDINLSIEKGERVCLVGRNGEGKSTLMKVVEGVITPDSGAIERKQGLVISRLAQEVPVDVSGSVYDVVADALGEEGKVVALYHHLLATMGESEVELAKLASVQHQLDDLGGWAIQQRVDTALSRLLLDGDVEFSALSGGLKRRVLLARALVLEPDLLLLDEPTNHLDIKAVSWIEEFLINFNGALLFVTHDRALLKKCATRIVDLDRGMLTSWPGNYGNYLLRKEEYLEAERTKNKLFDKKLAQEEIWIRQGIKARRTRNEGRVRALKELRKVAKERRDLGGSAKLSLQDVSSSGKIVVEVDKVRFDYGGKPLISDFSATLLRGDKVGIIGPNGSGKTTLLNILLGKLKPNIGQVKLGTKLEVIYFDQLRSLLNDNLSVQQNVAEHEDFVLVNGKQKHVIGYLQDFLFTPERARTPVKALSGGERNRLLLAKLFTKTANVLVMDEPTNDLDIETLELLEELLISFSGTLLLVSHDRAFLNNVVTSTLVFEGGGKIGEYIGGYDDWVRQSTKMPDEEKPKKQTRKNDKKNKDSSKLTFDEQHELKNIPRLIETLEVEKQALCDEINQPQFYKQGQAVIKQVQSDLEQIESKLLNAYARWEVLED